MPKFYSCHSVNPTTRKHPNEPNQGSHRPPLFSGWSPVGVFYGNISTPCNHTFILTFPPVSKQHWNSTNQTIQAAVKHKKTSPLKYLSFLVFKLQMPDKPLFNHRYRQYFHFYRMGLTKHLWSPHTFCTITGLGTKKTPLFKSMLFPASTGANWDPLIHVEVGWESQ